MAASAVSVDTPETDAVFTMTEGDVTSPLGFRAAGVCCGLRRNAPDLALVVSDRPATVAGVFTRNKVRAAPVLYSEKVVAGGAARAIVCNSANANACTGEIGLRDAQEMASLAAEELGLLSSHVLVASTGVIGVPLKMELIRSSMPALVAALGDDGAAAAEAILTTDTFAKTASATVTVGEATVTIGAIAKGAGMIQPNMATTLCFVTTDAAVAAPVLQGALGRAIEGTFNSVTVDGDTSTNDCALVMANGASGVTLDESSSAWPAFEAALESVLRELAKMLVRDGEGATKLVEVRVEGAKDDDEARRAAFTIANSPLVKTALYGCQVNWGRVLAAAGRADVELEESATRLWFGEHQVVEGGLAIQQDLSFATETLKQPEVLVRIDLGVGEGRARVWTSDLTEEYIRINGSYIS